MRNEENQNLLHDVYADVGYRRMFMETKSGYGGAFGVFFCNGYIHDFYGIRGGCRAGRPRSARQNKGAGGIMVCYR